MKHAFVVFLLVLVLLLFPAYSFAASSYVLPYPGIMPGNKLYKLQVTLDEFQGYISFGDFSQFKYNLSESDKYLVEAKTLFEYSQYPLALSALKKSSNYFKKVYPFLIQAKKHSKNTAEKEKIYETARIKHIEVLNEITGSVPESFTWQDEKKSPVRLDIKKALQSAIEERNNSNE